MKPFGLLGGKLGHSWSPLIHSRFGSYEYRFFEKTPEELPDFLRSGAFAGLNVTIPYKKAVIPYCATLSEQAARIGSVNTVTVDSGGLHGYNTDYFGFCHMLRKANISVKGEHCVVLGAGGASATVCVALQDLGAAEVTVVSHKKNTPARIAQLADAGILVNTTPVGMFPDNGNSPVDLAAFRQLHGVADLIFNPQKTALLLEAETKGIPYAGGLDMLVAQAKQASELFQACKLDDGLTDGVAAEIRALCENIVLIGMPGCGKSEVGQRLAEKLGKKFVDTDAEVERMAGKSIPAIFESDGEDAFRALETQALANVSKCTGQVIATGGGIVKRSENISLLRQNGRVLFLERSLQLLPRKGRPLSSSADAVQALYQERFPLYCAAADLRCSNDGTIQQTLAEILKLL